MSTTTNTKKIIYGIQQIGVGVPDAWQAFEWYATRLGADVKVFDDNNTATHMAKYMGGEPHKKRALMAMNLQGGSGYEIWQYEDRVPEAPKEPVQMGDLGIHTAIIKTTDIDGAAAFLKSKQATFITEVSEEPDGQRAFIIADPYGSWLKVKESSSWFANKGKLFGGVNGASIGVSDIDAALRLYRDVLGYDQVVYDETDSFSDIAAAPGGSERFRRVLLKAPQRKGGFSALLGPSELELFQAIDSPRNKIFADRYWGDIGFIHLCFDIRHMDALVEECAAAGFPFQVLSEESFEMGEAGGRWGYIEDPDGTLIEFVETHRVPLFAPLNLGINMRKRDPLKPLPNWLLRAMAIHRVKFPG